MTDSIEKLVQYFLKFPGIGPRQARRFVYFLLGQSSSYLSGLTGEISAVKSKIQTCSECMRYFMNETGAKVCSVCADSGRNAKVLMVVEKDVDFESMEKSGCYGGFYFVLGGSLPILEKEPEKRVRIRELLSKVEKNAEKIEELILSMSLTPDGENTIDYLKNALAPLSQKFGFKISALGRGLSTGTEIEYSDKETIKEALKNRH